MLPFITRLDNKEEAHDENMWYKANPSLYYRSTLLKQIRKEYVNYKESPHTNSSFLTKRMNVPMAQQADIEVTSWENIKATNQELPDLTGYECTVGIDFSKTSDMMSACLLFRKNSQYHIIAHSWICKNSNDYSRIKAPLEKWEQMGLLTIVDDVEIPPSLLFEWLEEQELNYDFIRYGVDNFRYTLLADHIKDMGVNPKNRDELIMVRPSDIMKIVPVVDSLFNKHELLVGEDNEIFNWCANNTKLAPVNKGNFEYDKIEPKSRKNDLFMAFIHALIASIGYLEDSSEDEDVFLDISDLDF